MSNFSYLAAQFPLRASGPLRTQGYVSDIGVGRGVDAGETVPRMAKYGKIISSYLMTRYIEFIIIHVGRMG
jgi:hypothetical protein